MPTVKVTRKFYDEHGKLIRIETWEEIRERVPLKDAENGSSES